MRIPPHIAWPGAVIVLLLMNVTISLGTLALSRADGGSQVVEDYYRKAVDWDARAALVAGSEATGWEVSVSVLPAVEGDSLRPVVISVFDRDGNPVEGLAGSIRAFRPHRTAAVSETELTAATPGLYRQSMRVEGEGVWDFELSASRDTFAFIKTIRTVLD